MGDVCVEHGEIVVVVTCGEDAVGADAQLAAELLEDAAFVILDVAEAEVDGVALISHEWKLGGERVDELDDAIHLWVVACDDAGGLVLVFDPLCAGVLVNVGAHLFEETAVVAEEAGVLSVAVFVPVAEVDPAVEARGFVEFALFDAEEIGHDGHGVLGDSGDGLEEAATCVDGPDGTLIPQGVEYGEQGGIDHRLGGGVDECAVEVEAEEKGWI